MALANTWFCSDTLALPKSGRVAAVGSPGRGAELVEPVVPARVHDLGVTTGLGRDDARLERAGAAAVAAWRLRLRGRGRGRGRARRRVAPSVAGRAGRAGGRRGSRRERRGCAGDLGRLGRDGQHLSRRDLVRVLDLAVVRPVQHGPVVRAGVEVLRDRGERVTGLDDVLRRQRAVVLPLRLDRGELGRVQPDDGQPGGGLPGDRHQLLGRGVVRRSGGGSRRVAAGHRRSGGRGGSG